MSKKRYPRNTYPESLSPDEFARFVAPAPVYAPPPMPYPAVQRNAYVQALQDKNASVVEVRFQRVSDWNKPPDYQFAATGSAKREQGDRHDPLTGELLAASRAFERLARQLRHEADKRVAADAAEREAAEKAAEERRRQALLTTLQPPRRRTKEEWEILKRHRDGVLARADEFLANPSTGRKRERPTQQNFPGTPAHEIELTPEQEANIRADLDRYVSRAGGGNPWRPWESSKAGPDYDTSYDLNKPEGPSA